MPISALANQDSASQLLPSAEVKSSHEYRALHDYVHSKSESVSHAQDKFCQQVENIFMKDQDPEAVEGQLWKAWSAVTGLATETSGSVAHQERLVDLILGLSTRPKLQKGDRVCKVMDGVVWTDLPGFGRQVREVFNFAPTKDTSADAKAHWLHLNTFLALLVETAQSKKVNNVDFSLYAIWAIRQGLEESERPAEVDVEVAALWLRYAASAIYALSQQNKGFDGKLARAGSQYQDKQWTGFSVERWRSWSSKLSDLQDQKLGKQCEASITQARQTMAEFLER